MYLIYDTETTGLPANYNAPLSDSDNWPRLVQIAWQVHDKYGKLIDVKNYIIKPEGFEIPYSGAKIHGITTERALKFGMDLQTILEEFSEVVAQNKFIIGHNVSFDNNIVGAEFYRKKLTNVLEDKKVLDTKELGTDFCAIANPKTGRFKWPNLGELYQKLFDEPIIEAHNAAADVEATARCFLEMLRKEIIPYSKAGLKADDFKLFQKENPDTIQLIGLNIEPYNPNDLTEEHAEEVTETPSVEDSAAAQSTNEADEIPMFTHLHLHTQYSILDGMTNIKKLAAKLKEDGQQAVAITDHGNMYGVKEFHKTMTKAGIKPIIGMEAYLAKRTRHDKENADKKSYHLVLLAKNETGYRNLIKLSSLGFSEGYYYKPRIDKELLRTYSEGIIASSACLGGEINSKLMHESLEAAEQALLEYKSIFGDDFYLEIQRHPAANPEMNQSVYQDQQFVNKHLLELAEKHDVKYIATNDVHFLNEEDAAAHDRLICLNTGRMVTDEKRMRYTGQEWMKTREEMARLFADLPEAIANTQEIAAKVESYELDSDPIMPRFAIPEEFGTIEGYREQFTEEQLLEEFGEKSYRRLGGYDKAIQIKFESDYLKELTYKGAEKRWGELTDEIKERLEFELQTIKTMGFPGYFLIVQDFLNAARDMDVSVGPGRGSAAGSAVAYCLRITDIDPLKYNLLFERFLNPDRISMPDIDIDFDDEGRDKVLQWVKEKYGEKRVAHLITFGTMAAKSSIRDVARVQDLPLPQANTLAKYVPDKPGTTLEAAFSQVSELKEILENGKEEERSVLDFAKKLEGSVRNTGTHACGIIIGRDDLDKYVPITHVKDSALAYATQYDGHYVEDIGLLKMDFLGLKTLTIIKDAIKNIKISRGFEVDIENVPLDDKETYELYARGETTGLFQFESDGMKKHLKNLKPTKFEDLIAMNALYRPGPMDYIDSFIARKHGKEKITYDLEGMEEYLAETYGITVYQEQVMLLSRKLAGFTPGESDSLRKAMGKKIISMMNELKVKFEEGCAANGHDPEKVQKVWKDWEKFASYAFNKSHATCYSYVSYQTAYLKAHYPAEFMAAILSHELKDTTKLNLYLSEANQMGLKVLGPSINESYSNFTVNAKGEIRYGLAGIKGVGEAAVAAIIAEREENGQFESIFDLAKRVNLRTVNKKTLESLAMAGAFDGLQNAHRAQFFYTYPEGDTFLDRVIKHGNRVQQEAVTNQASLFGGMEEVAIKDPEFPDCEPWSDLKRLKQEKQMIGFYLSGHPLDNYRETVQFFVKNDIFEVVKALENQKEMNATVAGSVVQASEREAKNGSKYGLVTIEDESASMDIWLFKEDYLKYKHFLQPDTFVYIKLVVKKRYGSDDNYQIKVLDMSLLDNVLDENTKEILMQVMVSDINDELIGDFKQAIKANPGNALPRFYFRMGEQVVELHPGKGKVKPREFITFLRKYPNIRYKLK
jgi:DNA polymerase-3 subunit alpha